MQVPIPDDWDGESFCRWAVCWPDSVKWKAILYGLIEDPNQGRFWDFSTGNFLTLREQFKPAYDYNFNLKGVIMTCENDVSAALFAIANALRGGGGGGGACCGDIILSQNGGVQNVVVQPGSGDSIPLAGSVPGLEIAEGEFPEGYADLEEYDLAKCQIANGIVDGFINTLRGLAAIGTFQSVGTGALIAATAAGMVIMPEVVIPMLVVAMAALVTGTTFLALAADHISDNREDWVCALYEGDSADSVFAVLGDLIDALVAAIGTTSLQGAIVKQIILLLANADTLNQLFGFVAFYHYPDADCGSCGPCGVVLDYEFAATLEGWGVVSATCDSIITSTAEASASWTSGNGGSMAVTASVVGSNSRTVVEVSGLSEVIEAGMEFVVSMVVGSHNIFSRLYVTTAESGCVAVGSGALSAGATGDIIGDLSSLDGETLESLQITVENSIGQTADVNITEVIVGCVE